MMTPSDYSTLWETAVVTSDPRKLRELDYVSRVALTHRELYAEVERQTGVPWPLVSAIHFRESDQRFNRHLHNGDPITARTVHVPKGRPIHGEPPYTWIESAVDALSDTWRPPDTHAWAGRPAPFWSMAASLEFLERFNGRGYQNHGVNTPYLWNFTDKYSRGLYVGDGKFDPLKIEHRPGCVAIILTLIEKGALVDPTWNRNPRRAVH